MIERISIELPYWENTIYPICTKDVNLEQAEKDLYASMAKRYTNEQIEEYLKFDLDDDDDDKDKFILHLWDEEENAILNNGGVYYENLKL